MIKNIGQFRTFAVIQRATYAADATTNEPVATYANYKTDIPCSIENVTGGEIRRGRQMQAVTTALLRMHHHQDDFTVSETTDQIIVNGQTLGIVAAYDPNGRREELFIECRGLK